MKAFLEQRLGLAKGQKIYHEMEVLNEQLLNEAMARGKSKTQMKTLKNTIMPRIALYKILQNEGFSKDQAYDLVKSYMTDVVCVKMSAGMQKFDKIPGVYHIFKIGMLNSLLKKDNWQAELISEDQHGFTAHVHKCLWYDTTVENDCPELCRAFCECDDINFSALSKVDFYREGALGLGSNRCDFTFRKAGK